MAAAVQPVTIATYDGLPPFAYRNQQGELTGIYIEIVKAAVAKMPDYTVNFTVMPWTRAKRLVELGEVFAILPPYFHAHDWLTSSEPRRPYIWPYSLPLFTQHDVVICNQQVMNTPRPAFPADYQGLTFVMWRGDGRAGEHFAQLVAAEKIKVVYVSDIKATINTLLSAKANCTVTAKTPFNWYMDKLKNTGGYQLLIERYGVALSEVVTISSNDGFLGYTDIGAEKNFPYKKDFTIKFDIAIYHMKKSGELQQIIERFSGH